MLSKRFAAGLPLKSLLRRSNKLVCNVFKVFIIPLSITTPLSSTSIPLPDGIELMMSIVVFFSSSSSSAISLIFSVNPYSRGTVMKEPFVNLNTKAQAKRLVVSFARCFWTNGASLLM
jgi:hypothetical protein